MTSFRGAHGRHIVLGSLLLAHLGLVWLLPYFPSQDGPSHLYNLDIVRDLTAGGGKWGEYYDLRLTAQPNLGFLGFAYGLARYFPLLACERMYLSLYVLTLTLGAVLVFRTLDRPLFPHVYLVFPVLFNFTVMMGFYSYAMGVALFLVFFWAVTACRKKSFLLYLLAANALGLLLYLVHVIPFALFLLATFAMAAAGPGGVRRRAAAAAAHTIAVAPLLFALSFYLYGFEEVFHENILGIASPERLLKMAFKLLLFSSLSFEGLQALAALVFAATFALFLVSWRKARRERTAAAQTQEGRAIEVLAAACVVLYFISPFRLGDQGSYLNERLPPVIFLLLLPLVELPEGGKAKRVLAVLAPLAAVAAFAVNTAAFARESSRVAGFLEGLGADIPRGATVMTYRPARALTPLVDSLAHAASYYGISKGCIDIGNHQAGVPHFFTSFSRDLPHFPPEKQILYHPESIDWSRYPGVDYLLGWELTPGQEKNVMPFYSVLFQRGRLVILKRAGEDGGDRGPGSPPASGT